MRSSTREHLDFDTALAGASGWLAGVDEAGRGCLAGPVVAGAVIVSRAFYDGRWCEAMAPKIDDSKKLSPAEREEIFESLPQLVAENTAFFATGEADAREIDRLNILGATRLAMRRALIAAAEQSKGRARLPEKGRAEGLFALGVERPPTALVIVDGLPLKPFPYEHAAFVGGDGRSLAIGLASIVAKVTRDRLITALGERYPQYGFAAHKGYGTPQHREALLKYGPCELHRASFLGKIMAEGRDGADPQSDFAFG
ncbi:MAG TPA: ribonuclease HII [Opitutales bacterium]|nr:ribonuclease HII [Opitutales bacterium]